MVIWAPTHEANSQRLTTNAPLRLDTWTGAWDHFKVRKPKVLERCQEVRVRESPDELTLRAEEVGMLKAYVNVDHIEPERWGLRLVDYDWYAFCQALYKGIEGEDGEKCIFRTKK